LGLGPAVRTPANPLPAAPSAPSRKGWTCCESTRPGIPNFDELNERLNARTGWTVVAVPGLVPDDVFFEHLSRRRFPAGNFIRKRSQLDYLEEPDVFHDVFGHVPLLAQPGGRRLHAELGELGLAALKMGALKRIARLYWYTVEFGLAREGGRTSIYGAGILSSFGESRITRWKARSRTAWPSTSARALHRLQDRQLSRRAIS
jgi:phenylalanine-4-hydroxylase